jgi:hypothetical protein
MTKRGQQAGAILVVAALSVGGLAATPAFAASPVDGGPITTIFPVLINGGSGDQYFPHVDGDLVSYTSNNTIRVYDFFSGDDSVVPVAADSADQLSDVSNGRVLLSRLDLNTLNQSVLVYDVGTGTLDVVDPQPNPYRWLPAIGADTVAFIDTTLSYELFAAHLGGSAVHITNDTRLDFEPQVAPLGNLIVYQSCETSLSNCDIHQATFGGSSWAVTALTTNADPEANPDTDGGIVVYDAIRSGERDIRWQPVGGGPEQVLTLPGEQRNPSVSAGVILFESVAPGDSAADLWVYEISTHRLFRITSTPFDESLSDISVLGDGRVRVVWTSGSVGDRDVYGATMELPAVGPTYHFGGFTNPVDALPTLNQMKAGAAVPVKFGLGGDFGLNIFDTGYPKSQQVACDSSAPVDGVEVTVTAGGSSLQYDPSSSRYTYVWKTDKAWAGTCRQLVVGFADGSFGRANFKFK